MIRVTAGIIENSGKILIARRKKGLHLEGFWELPGGKIEEGESAEECLRRELKEEFSIETTVLKFIAESVYEYPGKTIQLLGYSVSFDSGDFLLKDHDKILWITIDDIVNYKFAPADIPILQSYASRLI